MKRCGENFISKTEHATSELSQRCVKTTKAYVGRLSDLQSAMDGHDELYNKVVDALFAKQSVKTGYARLFFVVRGALALAGSSVAVVRATQAARDAAARSAARRRSQEATARGRRQARRAWQERRQFGHEAMDRARAGSHQDGAGLGIIQSGYGLIFSQRLCRAFNE